MRLRRRGLPVADAYVDFFERAEGLEVRGLRIGVGAVPSAKKLASYSGGSAIAVATAPSDALMWIDIEGTVYDDTDLERAVPVGHGAVGLLEYWLLKIGGQRWSGAVHDCIARVAGVGRDALREFLPSRLGELAVGEGLSMWSVRAGDVSDALDHARPVPGASAVLSADTQERWVGALLAIDATFPHVVLGLDIPSPPFLRPPGASGDLSDARWVRCQDRFSAKRDGWLVVRVGDDGYELFVATVDDVRSPRR